MTQFLRTQFLSFVLGDVYKRQIFTHDTPDFINNYRIVHDKDSNKVIEGLLQ